MIATVENVASENDASKLQDIIIISSGGSDLLIRGNT